MITEQYKDKVYFSKLLCTDCPNIYKDICEILDANNVAHETLSLTKDYSILRLFFENLLTAPRSQVFNPLKI